MGVNTFELLLTKMIETFIDIRDIKLTPLRTKRSYLTTEEYDRLKMAIRVGGLHHGIFVNQDLEILDGEMRLQAYKELNREFPEAFGDIKAFVLSVNEEVNHLMSIVNNNPSDYELDSAIDRLNILGKAPVRKDLVERVKVGKAIREGLIDIETIREYKRGEISHEILYLIEFQKPEDEKKFDVQDWL